MLGCVLSPLLSRCRSKTSPAVVSLISRLFTCPPYIFTFVSCACGAVRCGACRRRFCSTAVFWAILFSPQSSLQQVGVRIVGCGFTMADLVFQRISAVTTCLGADLTSDVTALGFGRSVPESCNEDEVRRGRL